MFYFYLQTRGPIEHVLCLGLAMYLCKSLHIFRLDLLSLFVVSFPNCYIGDHLFIRFDCMIFVILYDGYGAVQGALVTTQLSRLRTI